MLNFTHKRKSVSRVLAPVAIALLLAACGSTPEPPTVAVDTTDVTAAATDSAASYLLKAEATAGSESISWRILTLKALVQQQRWAEAEQQANMLKVTPMNPIQMAEWQFAVATMRGALGDPQAALDTINLQPWWPLSQSQLEHSQALEAALYSQANQPIKSARARVKQASYRPESEQTAIWQMLWQELSATPNSVLQTASLGRDEWILEGWISVAIMNNHYRGQPIQFQNALDEWLSVHPEHPINGAMPTDLAAIQSIEIQPIDKVALLLPLTGKYEKSGNAVRDGFLSAMLNDSTRTLDTELTVIDTNTREMTDIINDPVVQGADLVVGPLLKSKINAFQAANTDNLRMLALNVSQGADLTQPNSCFFPLSAEQEAQQAARHLFEQGHQSPMVLAPGSSLGKRVSQAFLTEWESLTGETPSLSTFSNRNEIQQQIAKVFGLSDSQDRIEQMKQILGDDLETEQRSRRDTDAVYLIANQGELSLLKPFIDVAINPDITPPKLYASSRSYPNRESNTTDLNGVEFSDIPVLINPDNQVVSEFDQLHPGATNRQLRLFAFGMDAYMMLSELPQMQVMPNYATYGHTGQLTLSEQCVVLREMQWGVFTANGVVPAQ